MNKETVREQLFTLLPPWYEAEKRTLPWRGTGNPYDVWLSEIMLQQTRVEAVKGYFTRFKEALPTIGALAQCPEDRLLKLWEGLGYYSRVRNLKKCAELLVREYGGALPRERAELLKLPGIGPYTAGAIASIAYEKPAAAVDGNVLRVHARIFGDEADIALPETRKRVEAFFEEGMHLSEAASGSRVSPSVLNQALMELGAIVCVPNGVPLCERCPVREHCTAHREGSTDRFPYKSGKKPRRIEARTVVILQDGERFLIQKRPKKGLLAGLYEFPSLPGHCEEQEVLARVQALGLEAVRIRRLPDAKHIFTHVEWHMRGYLVKLSQESRVDEALRTAEDAEEFIREHVFVTKEETGAAYALPSAFASFARLLQIERESGS